jgi:hypothetical protein
MCGELGYAAAYVHLFYMLSCVERVVRPASPHKTTCKTKLMFLTGSICLSPAVVTSVKRLYSHCAGQMHSLK